MTARETAMLGNRLVLTGSLALVGALAAPSHALAQDTSIEEPAEEVQMEMREADDIAADDDSDALKFVFNTNFSYYLEADLDDDGDVSISRLFNFLSITAPIGDTAELGVTISNEWSNYDFSGADQLSPESSSAWDDVFIVTLIPNFTYFIDDEWSILGGGVIRYAGESDADFDDSVVGGGFLAAGYQHNPDFYVSFGVLVIDRLERDAIVVPYLGLDWKIEEDLSLTYDAFQGLSLRHAIQDDLELSLSARYDYREFRLDDLGDDPDLQDPVITDEAFQLGTRLRWHKPREWEFYFGAGAVLYQEYTRQRDDGRKLHKEETDPTPYFEVGFTLFF